MKYLHYAPVLAAVLSVYFVFSGWNTPSPEEINSKKAYSEMCRKKLNEDLETIAINGATEVSEKANFCHKDLKNCRNSFLAAKNFENSLISADLRVRWNHFSCHPLLFSKFRHLEKAAREIQVFSQLKRKNEDIQKASKSILEPILFIKNNMKEIERHCCPGVTNL